MAEFKEKVISILARVDTSGRHFRKNFLHIILHDACAVSTLELGMIKFYLLELLRNVKVNRPFPIVSNTQLPPLPFSVTVNMHLWDPWT